MKTFKKINPIPVVEMTTKHVALEDLVLSLGHRKLTGVDFETVPSSGYYDEDACGIRFVLDGVTYFAVEEPSDGYRSSLGTFEQVDNGPEVKNTFPPVEVIVRMRERTPDDWEEFHILQLVDVKNGEVVLEVGTGNTDDYYPYFVGKFYPDKMSVNQ